VTYNKSIVFIETTHFTRIVNQYLTDDEYRELQQFLMVQPDAGDIIRGAGGIRKIRWGRRGIGKSGVFEQFITGQRIEIKFLCSRFIVSPSKQILIQKLYLA
jgi:hypothetical protein